MGNLQTVRTYKNWGPAMGRTGPAGQTGPGADITGAEIDDARDTATGAAVAATAQADRAEAAAALATSGMKVVEHGTNAAFPRPTWAGTLVWMGSVQPTGLLAGDVYWYVSAIPTPTTVWADTFTTAGPIGSTEVGGLPWVTLGTDYVAARSGGKQVFTAGSTSIGFTYVAAASSVANDVVATFQTTVSTKGTNNHAGIVFNVTSLTAHLALVRTSSASNVYRLVKRSGGAYSTIDTPGATWPAMADGDVIKVDIVRSTGAATFTINGTVRWSGTLVDYLASVGNCGHYCGSSVSFTEMAYDNASLTTLAAG